MDNPGKKGLVAKYTAQSLLKSAGFSAEKITGTSRTFDLIAWNYHEIIGLVIRTSRSEGISGFSSLVEELSKIVQKHWFPGEIQLWILKAHEWNRYRILPGGAMPCSGRFA